MAVDEIRQKTIEVFAKHIPRGPAALVDFPSHQNAGDTLIFEGEMEYLKRLGVSPKYLCDLERYDAHVLRRKLPTGPILMHGGGNFGDLWPRYQTFREKVMADFPDRKIVLLPQSINFSSARGLEAARDAIRTNPSVTLMLREEPSYKFAVENFGDDCEVVYCPDAAFGAEVTRWTTTQRSKPQYDVIYLLRQDRESALDYQFSWRENTIQRDWKLPTGSNLAWLASRAPGKISRSTKSDGVRLALEPMVRLGYFGQATLNLRNSVRFLSSGSVIVTDRLHAAILGGLLGKSVVAIDNNNQKISRIYGEYLKKLPNVVLAESHFNAEALIDERLQR